MAIMAFAGINPSQLANSVTGIVSHESFFVSVMNLILIVAIAFEYEYNKKFIATRTADIVKDIMSSDLWTVVITLFYNWYITVAKVILSHESVFTLAESLNSHAGG